MTTKYGVFAETQPLGPGSPSVKVEDARHQGLNMTVPICRQGKNNDATFDKFLPLFTGEPYMDPLKAQLRAQRTSKAANVSDKAFKPASPMKRSACPGDYIGALGPPVPHQEGCMEVHRKKGEVPSQPRNIITSTGSRTETLSQRQGPHGVAGEYEYLADPVREVVRKRSEQPVTPFRPVGYPKKGGPGTVTRHFNARTKGAVGEFEWRPVPPPDNKVGFHGAQDADTAAAPTLPAPFRPAAAPKKGSFATLGPLPEYLHDPEALRIEERVAAKKAEHDLLASKGAWRPNAGRKSDATTSIVRMNLR